MAKWRNKIKIKHMFTDDEDNNENLLAICDTIIHQLERIFKTEKELLEKHEYDFDFEMIIDNFKFIKHSIENSEEPSEYSFETWTEAFNEYLNILYDFGDMTVVKKDFWNDEKFLWVG